MGSAIGTFLLMLSSCCSIIQVLLMADPLEGLLARSTGAHHSQTQLMRGISPSVLVKTIQMRRNQIQVSKCDPLDRSNAHTLSATSMLRGNLIAQ